MNDTARRLRAQIPASTDPAWLERMECAAESAAAQQQTPARRRAAITAAELSDSISTLSVPVKTARGARR